MPSNGSELADSSWRKSTYSQVGECVEFATPSPGLIVVRDSKNPGGAVLTYTASEWRAFLHAARSGAYDLH
jgi:hypothetical protein